MTSALMALEAWAHSRIEAGEPFDAVLADILGPPAAPAAYLLVAVDLVLSHWPKSCEAAVPFLACPELLCLDRQRQAHDNFEFPDFFGLKALRKEPIGAASLDNLKQRPSRRGSLDGLLGNYAVFGPAELRERLAELLRRAAARLGPPDAQSDLGDPSFLAVHVLNLADPNNWQETSVELADGTRTTGRQYVSPEAENRHLTALQEASRDRFADANMQTALGIALDDPSRSSPEFAARAVAWAQTVMTTSKTEKTDEAWMREQAVVTAAMIAMRDGDAELRARHQEWVRGVFARALLTEEDPVHRARAGLRFNPIAIAFVGMIHLLKVRVTTEDLRALLDVAARDNPAAAHGLGAAATTLAAIDERLPRAVLRCAFAARVQPSREWDLPEEQLTARSERHRQCVRATVDTELVWLAGARTEPDWPMFPSDPVRPRRRLRVPGGPEQQEGPAPQSARPEEYADHQGAALWLRNAASLVEITKRPWLCGIVQTYACWTATANGAGLDKGDELASPPSEWNDAYYTLLAYCMPGSAPPNIDQLALTPINSLPDESFFDVVTRFLRSVDDVYFNDHNLQETDVVHIRVVLARHLMETSNWRWLARRRSTSIAMHIGPAIAVCFFNDYSYSQSPKCYLLPKGIDRLGPFIPVLAELVESGPCLFVALATLNLLEVSPRPEQLPFVVTATKVWLASYPDDSSFWVGHGIGGRVCALLDGFRMQEQELLNPEHALRHDVDTLLAALIRLGVAEAGRLETALAHR